MSSLTGTSGSSARPERALLAGLLLLGSCRGAPPGGPPPGLEALVDSLRPSVETAVGLPFKAPPRSRMVTREEVRAYVLERLAKEFPAERRDGVTAAYRLLGLLPDSLDLERLLLDLYTEQVAGYYDPGTSTLYGVTGGDPTQLRLIMAHELVHALQHQYLPLDSIMASGSDGDRTAAAQAVLEGHATLASVRMLAPDPEITASEAFWENYRLQVRSQQGSMPVFTRAPLVLREALIFPYLSGASFMRWWAETRRTPLPAVAELPVSTEQVIHPDRYATDPPVPVRFADSAATVRFEDTLGELETQVFLAALHSFAEPALDRPIGWGGDRYRVYDSADGPALVWYSVWDGVPQADRFLTSVRAGLATLQRPGYRVEVQRVTVGTQAGVRLMHAPAGWSGWATPPAVRPPG